MNKENEVIVEAGIVKMPVSVTEFLEALHEYGKLKEAIAMPEDKMQIEGKTFLKKSYWRKVNNAFNLSVVIVSENRTELASGDIVWDFICEAIAKNGRKACGTGSCSIYEKASYLNGQFVTPKKVWSDKYHKKIVVKDEAGNPVYEPATLNSWHNARSTAETRAYNRAVSNLVGGGEVSAEEINIEHIDYEPTIKYENGKPETKTPQKIEQVDEAKAIETAKQVFSEPTSTKMISEKQVALIKKLLEHWHEDKDGKLLDIITAYKVDDLPELTMGQAKEIITKLFGETNKGETNKNG